MARYIGIAAEGSLQRQCRAVCMDSSTSAFVGIGGGLAQVREQGCRWPSAVQSVLNPKDDISIVSSGD